MDTSDSAQAYPLQWPISRTRTKSRKDARFSSGGPGGGYNRRAHSVGESVRAILDELKRMGAKDAVVSTNIVLRNDGLPRSGQSQPNDPGVAVYFKYSGQPVCLACDQWAKVEDNLWAVALTLDAMRGIDRWGAAKLEATFTGYAALPAPAGSAWWEVLGVAQGAAAREVYAAYRSLVKQHHPDVEGGDKEKFLKVQSAYQAWESQ